MRRLIAFFITLLFISCNETSSDSYTLEGNALGYADGTKVLVYDVVNNQTKIKDTLEIIGEKFSKTYPNETDTKIHLLRMDGSRNNIIYFVENEPIKATIYKDSLGASFVTGGKQNELYNEFNEGMASINKKKQQITAAFRQAQVEQDGILVNELRAQSQALTAEERGYKSNFVNENRNSVFSIMLLAELLGKEEMTTEQANQIIGELSPKMAKHPLVDNLKKTIEAKKKASIGGVAPDFSAPQPNGEMLSLKETLGKYTIIDFWASWCRPCRMENPNVVKVYNEYHDKGLNIISVSLDKANQRDRWLKAIEDDKMDWYHVSNLQFWQDPIARQYNVRSIPATFLLDEEGRIIDKNLRGAALQQKIASLLD
ncbi:TlpA disulfide reductase family protein [Aureisphaera galaxeae]|uniref:TlpA disulfide reductase family protein n=1 Tax=Aureisphaera galaxeae TaxID=1538023 RepID=UPI002350A803|nr:TlpA disulfide reductase family protein [Aureisphaera galaxeae]MDC8004607.1 TlpA disulfide reductase family protein [Aureisphaera galaxeae]